MNILITGAAGYIGELLIEKFSPEQNIKTLVCIDSSPIPPSLAKNSKIQWIQADLAGTEWSSAIPQNLFIDIVIHCAFKIRNPYGEAATKATEKNNLTACKNIFSFAFARGVTKLIYLSSVAAYGAKPENIGRLLTEEEPLTETVNPYGYQKAESERILNSLIDDMHPSTRVFVLRLNSITGPRGQSLESKFGLITFLRKLLPFIIQANSAWARQFVHEDDLVNAIATLSFMEVPGGLQEIFNLAPREFLTAKDMARILHKRLLPIPAGMVKPLFFLAWHLSHGKVPTRPDSWAGLVYPINVDGTRIEHFTEFQYIHTAKEALLAKK